MCPISVQSALHFAHPIQWDDKGNYSCLAENSPTAPSAMAFSSISVVHEPVLLNPRHSDGMALAAAGLGETARISCAISAKPEPKVTWSRDGEEIGRGMERDRRYRVRMGKSSGEQRN